jgi:hypothetical protein
MLTLAWKFNDAATNKYDQYQNSYRNLGRAKAQTKSYAYNITGTGKKNLRLLTAAPYPFSKLGTPSNPN